MISINGEKLTALQIQYDLFSDMFLSIHLFQVIENVFLIVSEIRNLFLIMKTCEHFYIFKFHGRVDRFSAIFFMVSDEFVNVIDYFQSFFLIGAIFVVIDSGLFYILDINAFSTQYIDYQIIIDIDIDIFIQVSVIVVQTLSFMTNIPFVTADVLCKSSILIFVSNVFFGLKSS